MSARTASHREGNEIIIDDVKKLVMQLKRFDVFRVATTTSAPDEAEETTDADT